MEKVGKGALGAQLVHVHVCSTLVQRGTVEASTCIEEGPRSETKHVEKCGNGFGTYVVSFYLPRWRMYYPGEWMAHAHTSLEPRLSIFSKAVRQNPEWKAWVRGYIYSTIVKLASCNSGL